jgi:acetyl-CoA C-acetyltransferase
MSIKGRAAIIGTGQTRMTKKYQGSVFDLAVEAAHAALADADISMADVDGLVTVQSLAGGQAFNLQVADQLGLKPGYNSDVTLFGASGPAAVKQAAEAIACKAAKTVLIVAADLTPNAMALQGLPMPVRLSFHGDFMSCYGARGANSNYAMVAQLHSHLYGTTDEMRAHVAVSQRFNASYTPESLFGDQPLTIEQVVNSRVIASPLRLFECVPLCNGGLACVVTGAENLPKGGHVPVYIDGAGLHQSNLQLLDAPMLFNGLHTAIEVSGRKAFEMAGVGPEQMDVLGLYDCYTIFVIVTLEDLGFCKKGEGGHFVSEHDLTFKGDVPVNTSGGQLSCGQAGETGGLVNLFEVVRQLQGRCGPRQVPNAEFGVVNGNGGACSVECTLILRRGE